MSNLPDSTVEPDDLPPGDVRLVTITLPYWEWRKVLGAVRRSRRARAKQGQRRSLMTDPVPGLLDASLVDAAALLRAEAQIADALGTEVRP